MELRQSGRSSLSQRLLLIFGGIPRGFPIPVEELLRMWVAEGLCREEDEGIELLGIMVAISGVELADDGKTCKIHDVVRDVLRRSLRYNAETKIPALERMCLYEPGVHVSEFPNEWTGPSVFSARRLSLQVNSLRELPDQFNVPDLVVLMLTSTYVEVLPQNFFAALSNLRVLNLRGTQIQEVSRAVLKNLKSLVLLDLRYCKRLRKISDELNSLEELQILLLRGTELYRLPRMKALIKLHTLSLKLPLRVDSESLANVVRKALFQYRNSALLQVRGHPQLRRLEIVGSYEPLRPPQMAFEYARGISFFSALEELTIRDFAKLDYSEDLLDLRCMKILHMVSSQRPDKLPALDELPLLEEFSMTCDGIACSHAFVFPESYGRNGGFPSLKKLKLEDMQCRKIFTFRAGTMPKIEALHFSLLRLEESPVLLATLPTLKSLYLDVDSFGQRNHNWSILSRPYSFQNLERLILPNVVHAALPAPKLPPYLLERQEQGKLKVILGVDSRTQF